MRKVPKGHISLIDYFNHKGKEIFGDLWGTKEAKLPILPYEVSQIITQSIIKKIDQEGINEEFTHQDAVYAGNAELAGSYRYSIPLEKTFMQNLVENYNGRDEHNGTFNYASFWTHIEGKENYLFQAKEIPLYPKGRNKIFQQYQRRYYVEDIIYNEVFEETVKPKRFIEKTGELLDADTNSWNSNNFIMILSHNFAGIRDEEIKVIPQGQKLETGVYCSHMEYQSDSEVCFDVEYTQRKVNGVIHETRGRPSIKADIPKMAKEIMQQNSDYEWEDVIRQLIADADNKGYEYKVESMKNIYIKEQYLKDKKP